MRLLAVIALGLALVSAGCFGDDEEPTNTTPTPPTATTPVTTTPATNGTGTGGGTGTGSGNGTGTTQQKAPMEVHNDPSVSFAHAPGVGPTAAPPPSKAFTVPAGYTKLTLNVTWTATGPVVAQNGVSINILGPDGSPVVTCAGPAAGPGAPSPCTAEGPALPAGGEYTAQYAGSGNLNAAVVVVAS